MEYCFNMNIFLKFVNDIREEGIFFLKRICNIFRIEKMEKKGSAWTYKKVGGRLIKTKASADVRRVHAKGKRV